MASLAGMALVFPLVMFQLMLSDGAMGGGVSSAVSWAFGAGDAERANALAVHALWIGLAAGSANMALMLAFGPALFAGLGDRSEALAQAVAFSNLAFLGSIFVWLSNTSASVIRGSGNMLVPSANLVAVAVAVAVALGQVLIGGALGLGWGPLPRLGMPGVAAGQVLAYAIGVASVPLVGMAIGASKFARARKMAWTASAMAFGLLGVPGGVLALVPDLWAGRLTRDAAVIAAAAVYFQWAGPCYGLLGLCLCLYFSSLGAGKVGGAVLAGTLRLMVLAAGGAALALAQAPAWTIFALVALGMAAYGLATVLAVRLTSWGVER